MKKQFISSIISILLVAALVAVSGCGNKSDSETTTSAENSATTVISQTVPDSENDAAATESVSETTAPSAAVTEEETTLKKPETVEEIVEYFNKSANRIKTEATKVVKNYEKRIIDKDNLVVPKALESLADSLIDTFMKDDTEPIVYSTKEEIRNEYIVPEQDYVSVLKAEYVKEATCVDKGDVYEITIKLKDEKNPTAGSGVASVCDVIEAHEVSDKVSFVESFTTEYNNCEVRVTVDKATGRVVKSHYITPLVLDVTINMFGTHRGAVGLTFEKDYTITY